MKRIILGMLFITMIFSGCTKKDNGTETDKKLEDFNVVLDWYPNAVHGFIYAAIENGYYEEEGLKVNVQFPSGTNDAMSLTAAGKVDAGIYYMHDVVLAKANQDVPIKSLGAICQQPLNILLSLKEKDITEPKDLIGKIVGQSGSELSEATIKFLVEGAGGNPDDTNVIDVGFDLMSSMTTGNVDVTLGAMVNHEVPQMEEEGFEVNYFYPTDYGMPNYYELILITGQKQIDEEPEKLAKFVRASEKGFEYMKNNPEETLEIILSNQNEENFALNPEVEKKSLDILLPTMETDGGKFLSQDENIWDENINWLYDNGLIKNSVDSENIIVEINR